MVCVQSQKDGAWCVVRDILTDVPSDVLFEVTVPGTTPVQQFVQQVASHFNYKPGEIELVLTDRPADAEADVQNIQKKAVLRESSKETLQEIGAMTDQSKNNFLLRKRKVVRRMGSMKKSAFESLEEQGDSLTSSGCRVSVHGHQKPSSPSCASCAGFIKQLETVYVGLVNQAMTCYLNSLLQALFMTPEFRNALYNWEYGASNEKTDPSKCIPYQLQRLFINLQTSSKSAVETTELTKSFGWDSSEAWQQHDIQELCRVMFDALEQVLKGTKQADLIDRLYQGKMIDYVKCLECGTQKSREDTFLDIPLPIRPFGSCVPYGCVVEALRGFVQPETLDGTNQYFCEACGKKCDAHKGLKFTKFPYLLTLHLKRFDFDYNTMHRIKLNDKLSFSEVLNLNSFVEQEGGHEEVSAGECVLENELTASKCDDSSTTDSGSALDDEGCQGTTDLPPPPPPDINQDDDEGIDVSAGNISNHIENEKRQNIENLFVKGDYSYELFAVMIHSGSASGGHYYAYIKDLKDGQWLCFNDTSVTRIRAGDVAKTFGGGGLRGSYYSGAYSSSTNAYMLMYRQICDDNAKAITVDEFPPHIQELYREMIREKQENDRCGYRSRYSDTTKLKVYCNHPSRGMIDARVYVDGDSTLDEVVSQAYDVFKLSELMEPVNLSDCRLVSYNPKQESIEESFEGRERLLFSEVMSNVKYDDMLLEIKNPDEEFEEYEPGVSLAIFNPSSWFQWLSKYIFSKKFWKYPVNTLLFFLSIFRIKFPGITVKVFVVDLETDEIQLPPLILRKSLSSTIGGLKTSIGMHVNVNISVDNMVIVTEKYTNELQALEDDTTTLDTAGIYSSNKIYVSRGPLEKPFIDSKLYTLIDRFEHIITLHLTLPDTDPDTLTRMSIPSLSSYNSAITSKEAGDSAVTPTEKAAESVVAVKTPIGSRGLVLPLILTGSGTSCGGGGGDEEAVGGACGGTSGGGHSDQSTSEDSSLTDSDRTLIGDVQDDCLSEGDNQLTSPPEEGLSVNQVFEPEEETWDEPQPPIKQYNYFRASPFEEDSKKMLKVVVDKRMAFNAVKACLEPYVGVPASCFKLYRCTGTGTEYESSRSGPLDSFLALRTEDTHMLNVRLGRKLTCDEHRVKVYHLVLNDAQPIKFLCDWIVARGVTVGQTKRAIIDDLNKRNGMNLQFDRCRLRKKNWRNVGHVYLNDQKWMDDLPLYSNEDMFLQELSDSEAMTPSGLLSLFVRHWHPSTLTLDPFIEIILDSFSIDELKMKLSEMSGIPVEHIQITRPPGFFPCDVSVVSLDQTPEWKYTLTTLENWPFNFTVEGGVIFFRDNREECKPLTKEEKMELSAKESARLTNAGSTVSTYSPRKERPLKIYLDRRPQSTAEADID